LIHQTVVSYSNLIYYYSAILKRNPSKQNWTQFTRQH